MTIQSGRMAQIARRLLAAGEEDRMRIAREARQGEREVHEVASRSFRAMTREAQLVRLQAELAAIARQMDGLESELRSLSGPWL